MTTQFLPVDRPRHNYLALMLTGAVLAFVPACGILDPGDDENPVTGPVSVLFIGNSYSDYYDLSDRFEGFAEAAGAETYVRSRIIPGYGLDFFAGNKDTADLIRVRAWDFVVLQGGIQNAAYPADTDRPLLPSLTELHRIATESSPNTRVIYMMPWAFEDGMLLSGGSETYAEMQLAIRGNAVAWAEEVGLGLAPVGMAWYEVLTTWDPPEHYLHLNDYHHPSYLGAYLSAATIFSTIFVRSVEDVPYDWSVEPTLAKNLRDVATRTVLENLALWNITWKARR